MIAHLVIWTWQPTVTKDQVDELVQTLREITMEMPSLHRYECGPGPTAATHPVSGMRWATRSGCRKVACVLG
jgi:hypothetical protein